MSGRSGSLTRVLVLYTSFVVAGAACLVIGTLIGHGGLFWVGVILLGVTAFGLVFSVPGVIRAAAQRARVGALPAGTRPFHAAVVSANQSYFRGYGAMGIAVVDPSGIRVLRGNPPAADWQAGWAEIERVEADEMSVGRQYVPVLDIATVGHSTTRLRLLGDHGLVPTNGYAKRLAAELEAQRTNSATSSRNVPGDPMLPGTTT